MIKTICNPRLILGIISILVLSCSTSINPSKDFTRYVNPFIGTGGHGHTYPGATTPFGMVQLSPDTRLTGWDGCSGYHYSDTVVYGFSHTHLSGTGIADYCDILIMPSTGLIHFNNGSDGLPGYSSTFNKETEVASPGYYSVQLQDSDILAELTVTPRVGFHKYTIPRDSSFHMILDLAHRDEVLNSGFEILSNTEIQGFRISRSWAEEQHVYFYVTFSRPFSTFETNDIGDEATTDIREGKNLQIAFNFDADEEPLLVKVALSPVAMTGAKKNLDAELPGWDFEGVKTEAENKWNNFLGKIEIDAQTPNDAIKFYTSLYHTAAAPNLFMDVDGQYRGMDKNIHRSDGYNRYTVFSLWDTYRAAHPLYTMIERERSTDFIKTFLHQFDEGGKLPMWELAGNYTYCMIGYHAVPVIADAYAKGIRNFDEKHALKAMIAASNYDEFGKLAYANQGFLLSEQEGSAVSRTLEYAYDDWCIAVMAEAMGRGDISTEYFQRAQSYKNILDPETGLMRPRVAHRWWNPFDPAEVNFNYTEANAWQYSFYVPHDITNFAALLGGDQALADQLDALFQADPQLTGNVQPDVSGQIGQYAHGNEPSHHIAYLYNYIGQPWKTQEKVREIMRELYHAAPDGLSGNEDCGQMSAWYVLSAIGLYSVLPGNDQYAIGSPNVNSASIHLESGKSFNITIKNQSQDNVYIQKVLLNKKDFGKSFITNDQIMKGGELEITLGNEPNKEWAIDPRDRPHSSIDMPSITPVPVLRKGSHSFQKRDTLVLESSKDESRIFYTIDGGEPSASSEGIPTENTLVFGKHIVIDQTTTLRAIAYHPNTGNSKEMKTTVFRIPFEWEITIENPYSPLYTGGGDLALIDHVDGGQHYHFGWQGYQQVDLDITIDLQEDIYLQTLGIRCLQDQNSWIFMPSSVEFLVSDDGKTFQEISSIKNSVDPKAEGRLIHTFEITPKVRTRYVKVIAKNIEYCPDWHKGAGGQAWVFADEILINR